MRISRIDELIKRQEKLESLDRDSIEKMQLEKLNALLGRERERGGFYRGLPERLGALGDLCTLPFTTDEQLSHNAASLLLKSQADIQRVLSDATSGTTGAAKRVFYTQRDCENTVELFMAGLGELVFPGSVTMICMPFSGPYGLGELIARAIEGLGARPLKVGVGRSYGELSEILAREKPDTFVGMPVQLLGLLRFCGAQSLQRALVSGDACPDAVLEECERIIGTRLFPHYGSREMCLGGAICCAAHEGMHLRENHVIAETVGEDGRVMPKGEYGELVITTIGMEAMPLIRYKTGDYTRLLSEKCPCGSEVLRLDKLLRREGLEMAALDEALFRVAGLIDFAVSERGGEFLITALTDGRADSKKLQSGAQKALGGRKLTLELRRAEACDRPLYIGKRKILQAESEAL